MKSELVKVTSFQGQYSIYMGERWLWKHIQCLLLFPAFSKAEIRMFGKSHSSAIAMPPFEYAQNRVGRYHILNQNMSFRFQKDFSEAGIVTAFTSHTHTCSLESCIHQ